MMLPPPCLIIGMGFPGCWAVFGLCHILCFGFRPNNSTLDHKKCLDFPPWCSSHVDFYWSCCHRTQMWKELMKLLSSTQFLLFQCCIWTLGHISGLFPELSVEPDLGTVWVVPFFPTLLHILDFTVLLCLADVFFYNLHQLFFFPTTTSQCFEGSSLVFMTAGLIWCVTLALRPLKVRDIYSASL